MYSSVKKSSRAPSPANAAWWKNRMSPPAQNPPNKLSGAPGRPILLVPRIATTLISESSRQARRMPRRSRTICSDSALRALGRFSVISPALPRRSATTSSAPIFFNSVVIACVVMLVVSIQSVRSRPTRLSPANRRSTRWNQAPRRRPARPAKYRKSLQAGPVTRPRAP